MPSRPKSVIYIVLGGGPSHIDMYDLKPDAPDEYRGPFKPIATKLPGVRICELMPLQAEIMDQLALLRGIRSVENDHFLSEVYSGPAARGGQAAGVRLRRQPAGRQRLGAAALRQPRPADDRPVRVREAVLRRLRPRPVPAVRRGPRRPHAGQVARPAAGPQAAAGRVRHDAARPRPTATPLAGLDRFQAQALDIITSPKVRDAFDLSKEPDRVLARYGQRQVPAPDVQGPSSTPGTREPFLLARRLVEAGVRVVTLRAGEWDHHSSRQRRHLPRPAAACCRCSTAASTRWSTTCTPAAWTRTCWWWCSASSAARRRSRQPGPGREHWADAGCAVLFGGGLKMGQVIGETDSAGRARQERQHQLPEHHRDDLPRPGHRPGDAAAGLQRPAAVPARRPRADRGTGRSDAAAGLRRLRSGFERSRIPGLRE